MENNEDLMKELEARGTAEVINGTVVPITQALSESEDTVEYLMFGNLRREAIIPIDEACSMCDFRGSKFQTVGQCREFQAKGSKDRGFYKLICARQLKQM